MSHVHVPNLTCQPRLGGIYVDTISWLSFGMFSFFSFKSGSKAPLRRFLKFPVAYCDADQSTELADAIDKEDVSLIEQADAAIENSKAKIKPPMMFEDISRICNSGGVDSYDGIRMIYQKQMNLNVYANHLWWLGSQQLQKGSIYQYRLTLAEEERMCSVGMSRSIVSYITTSAMCHNALQLSSPNLLSSN